MHEFSLYKKMIPGDTFGFWTLKNIIDTHTWLVECACGHEQIIESMPFLNEGYIQRCEGCYKPKLQKRLKKYIESSKNKCFLCNHRLTPKNIDFVGSTINAYLVNVLKLNVNAFPPSVIDAITSIRKTQDVLEEVAKKEKDLSVVTILREIYKYLDGELMYIYTKNTSK